jgi:hypothetical protein
MTSRRIASGGTLSHAWRISSGLTSSLKQITAGRIETHAHMCRNQRKGA